jgi:hypothetical protein
MQNSKRYFIFLGAVLIGFFQTAAGTAQYAESVPQIIVGNWYPKFPSSMKCGEPRTIVSGYHISSSGEFSQLSGYSKCAMTDFRYFDPSLLGQAYIGNWTYKISCRIMKSGNSPEVVEPTRYGEMKLEISNENKFILNVDESDNQASLTEAPKNLAGQVLQRCD